MSLALLFVFLGVRHSAAAQTAGDVTIVADLSILGLGSVAVIKDGTVSPLVAMATGVAVPASLNTLDLVTSSPSGLSFMWSTITEDDTVLVLPALDVPRSGYLTATGTEMKLSLDCVGIGEVAFSLTILFADSDGVASGEFTFSLNKVCAGGEAEALPSFCSPAATARAFADYKASTGVSVGPASANTPGFVVAAYNTHAISGLDEGRAAAIGSALQDADVLLLQELFSPGTRDSMAMVLTSGAGAGGAGFAHMLGSGLGSAAKATSSGLMIASRWPIVACGFLEFDKGEGIDASSAKGVAGALLHVGGGNLVYAFNTHMQAGGWRPGSNRSCGLGECEEDAVREAQMKQAGDFVRQSVHGAVATGWDRRRMAVVLGGDFNSRGVVVAATADGGEGGVAVANPGMVVALGGGVVDFTSVATTVLETALPTVDESSPQDGPAPTLQELCAVGGVADHPDCPQGAESEYSSYSMSGVDYLLTLDELGTAAIEVAKLSKAALCCKPASGGLASLSDHAAVVATVSVPRWTEEDADGPDDDRGKASGAAPREIARLMMGVALLPCLALGTMWLDRVVT